MTPTKDQREAERRLQSQAEQAYRKFVSDWRSTAPSTEEASTEPVVVDPSAPPPATQPRSPS